TGLLYWSTVTSVLQPWSNPAFAHPGHFNGGGYLFYPGVPCGIDGPVSSQRMKALRRGLQDYEYMWLLGEQGKADAADAAVRSVVRYGLGDAEGKKVGWSADPDDWDAAREAMAAQIAGGP
ncbi:MAG: DUF4091 domain-containing protein, partial [Actinobacteria bacterium]|nr:DUF4091 domain-containing protein [Actinomycetota bacterium]